MLKVVLKVPVRSFILGKMRCMRKPPNSHTFCIQKFSFKIKSVMKFDIQFLSYKCIKRGEIMTELKGQIH